MPGCWSQGDTEAEAIDDIKDVIPEYHAAVYDSTKDAARTIVEFRKLL